MLLQHVSNEGKKSTNEYTKNSIHAAPGVTRLIPEPSVSFENLWSEKVQKPSHSQMRLLDVANVSHGKTLFWIRHLRNIMKVYNKHLLLHKCNIFR